MKKGIVYRGTNLLGYAGWPSVGKLSDGTIAAVFSGDRLKHACPFGKSMISYSRDGGNTWSPAAAVVNTAFDDRDAGITVKGKQVLVSSFNNNYRAQYRWLEDERRRLNREYAHPLDLMIKSYMELNKDADEDEVGSSITISEDGGYTFPKKVMVPLTAPHGPIVLSDGRYFYVGRSFLTENPDKRADRSYDKELKDGIYCMFSSDGYNWSEPQLILLLDTPNTGYYEPHAVQLSNGEVLVQIRYHVGGGREKVPSKTGNEFWVLRTIQCVSSDGITKWSKPRDLHWIGSPPHLMRHSSGVLISSIGRREVPYAEQVYLSEDEGESWQGPYTIDAESCSDDMGYPATCELDDGSLLTVYYQHDEEGERNDIKYTIWRLEELK